MTVKELIEIEEKLLKFEDKEKFHLEFNDYLKLNKYLTEIGDITNLYFSLVKEYSDSLNNRELNLDASSRLLNNFNEKIYESKIDYNVDEIKKYMYDNNIK